jgi:DeoR/GlpR family transcriptional regulator of sugar metabolism
VARVTAADRHTRIVESLRVTGVASVRELAAALRVSESTIRRDLKTLHHGGELVRSYGGAALSPRRTDPAAGGHGRGEEHETPFDVTVHHDSEQKTARARLAAALVPDEAVVLLDIGTSTARIARELRGRPVTVITGNVAALDALRDDPAVRLVLLGGVLRRNYRSLVGPLALAALRQVSADVVFLSCTGVRPGGAVLDDMEVEAPLKQTMLTVADRRVLVASGRKFPGTGSMRLCSLTDLDTLITTADADPATVEAYRQAGGKVMTA